jgi:uncharacterized protein (DUF58 family)
MSLKRYATRRDANEPGLIQTARRLGAEFERTDKPLDWLCLFRGQCIPTEIKDPRKEGYANEFTQAQREFIQRCKNLGVRVWVWRSSEDVIRDLNSSCN